MTRTTDLRRLRAGFDDEALGSQAVFRVALDALSHPGRVLPMPAVAEHPRQGHAAAALLLLALLDPDCSVWLSPSLRAGDAPGWLRFHTGCALADRAGDADFLWLACGDAMPPLDALRQGTDADPDRSATCVLEVLQLDGPAADAAVPWELQGPGIADRCALRVAGAPAGFAMQWDANHARFPRGVDVLLAAPVHVAGLPRTTRLLQREEA